MQLPGFEHRFAGKQKYHNFISKENLSKYKRERILLRKIKKSKKMLLLGPEDSDLSLHQYIALFVSSLFC